jgi:predicted nucleotidyltransferase
MPKKFALRWLMAVFPIRVTSGDTVVKHIFPSKQKDVQAIINEARKSPLVRRVFVFGSAITWNCGVYSDLDIAVEYDGTVPFEQIVSPFFKCADGKTDIIEYNSIHDDLLRKSVENGVVVYERYD